MSLSMCETLIARRMLSVALSATRRLIGAEAPSRVRLEVSCAALKGGCPNHAPRGTRGANNNAAFNKPRYSRPPVAPAHGPHAVRGQLTCQPGSALGRTDYR